MTKLTLFNRTLGTALAAVLTAGAATGPARAAPAHPAAQKPTTEITIGVGTGRMVRIPGVMSDLFVADQSIADVQVRSANQIYIFGKAAGETTVYATNKAGRVVYSTQVRVGANFDSVGVLLRTAMPDAQITTTVMNNTVLLTGTVRSPEDIESATRIVQAYVGTTTTVISRLRAATPLQVMLRVRFAEVSRTLTQSVGFNLLTNDTTSGFHFGIGQGSGIDPTTGQVTVPSSGSALAFAGKLFGLNILSALDLAEADGRAVTLAEPTLTALSGETASFLAGGEFPIPLSTGFGSVSVDYKQYGVSLAFTPTVLDDGRISMRVRPEVSQLTDQGSIRLNNLVVPALTTRRAETTVELGSGQSFMIGGLLNNTTGNSVDKAPWLGDLPIIGALFRSNSFRRSETELVIVVTPYLVRPTSGTLALPTDGYRTSGDAERVLLDQLHDSRSGAVAAHPTMAPPVNAAPGVSSQQAVPAPAPAAAPRATAAAGGGSPAGSSAAPGFSF